MYVLKKLSLFVRSGDVAQDVTGPIVGCWSATRMPDKNKKVPTFEGDALLAIINMHKWPSHVKELGRPARCVVFVADFWMFFWESFFLVGSVTFGMVSTHSVWCQMPDSFLLVGISVSLGFTPLRSGARRE